MVPGYAARAGGYRSATWAVKGSPPETPVSAGESRRLARTPLIAVLVCLVLPAAGTTSAQQPEAQSPLTSGQDSPLPTLPGRARRSSEQVGSFVESLSRDDAAITILAGRTRLLTLREPLAEEGQPAPLIAVGDPAVVDYTVVGPRRIHLQGKRIGTTDLAITTARGATYSFQLQVLADLDLLRARLKASFPDARIKLGQIREHVVVEGQARDTAQIDRILQTVAAYLDSINADQQRQLRSQPQPSASQAAAPAPPVPPEEAPPVQQEFFVQGEPAEPQVINLLTVPGPQQIMLKVRIAELNRTAARQFGMSFFLQDQATQIGSNVSGAFAPPGGFPEPAPFNPPLLAFANPTTTISGIRFASNTLVQYWVDALRQNGLLKILAEPNLVAMNGHEARFLAGGEFPVPVPQSGAGGGPATVTIQYREFGVRLRFVPHILDETSIRLAVNPEVSSLDFENGIVLEGFRVPSLVSRNAHTVVELKQGQTLAIAGLLQVELRGGTRRVPLLGDLPVLGPFFSNNTSDRVEKELVVLVTPYLVHPMDAHEVPPLPGEEVNGPNDLEFYLLGRIAGRTGRDFRATTQWDDPLHLVERLKLEKRYCRGPCGLTE